MSLFITEIEHCCPLNRGDHQVIKFNMQIYCIFDPSTSSKTFFEFSKDNFDGLRDHFSIIIIRHC